jgi:haloalkane dehalogenase
MWRKLFLSFRENMRCIAPDHLGMGLSSRPMKGSYGFTLGERTSDLSAFIDSIIPDGKIHLVVHDWGGPIGLGWAAMHPERVSSITMMNTGLRVPLGFVLPPSLALFKKSSFLGWLLAEKFPFFTNGLARKGTLRPLTRDAKDGFLAPYTRAVFRKAISAFVEDIPLKGSHPSAPALQKVDSAFETLCCKPMSLIWGLRDFVFGPLFLQDFKKRAPHAKVLPLPRSGHYLLEDEPQKIVLALRHFLELCSSGSIKTR